MKNLRKVLTLVLAIVMVLAMGTLSAFATDGGSTASGNTISVSGAKNGESYNIYKMLELSTNSDATAYRYTLTNDAWAGFWTDGAGKDYVNIKGSTNIVTWKTGMDTADKMEALGKAAAAYAKDNSISPTQPKVVASGNKAEWTGLDNGYYLVTSTYGTAASIASTPSNPVQTILEKNTDNSSDKDVKEAAERNGTAASWGDSNDAQVGDTVDFRAKVTIAKNSIKVKYHDTMTAGLDWTGASKVKVYTDADLTTELAAANYSVDEGTDGETFVVSFTDDYVSSLTAASTDVYVSYSAVLNDNAVVGTSEVNTGKVTWGDKGKSEETTTNTDTHEFKILKYDGADTGKSPLAGAKFQLFTAETGGTAVALAKNADGTIYRVVDMSDSGATLPEGFTLVSDNTIVTLATDKITIDGVDSDDYWLEETEAPEGFNKIDGRTKVQVKADNSLIAEIPNEKGTVLPSTGGIGTTIFYILGSLLVIGGGIMLISRRRLEK